MATEVVAGSLGELRATSTASGGSALTTTASFIQFPALSKVGDKRQCHLFITPRNFATAVVAKIALNPWLTILKTTDDMATPPTDYSLLAQDNSTGTSVDLSSLSTVAAGDWLLVGSHQQFRGVYCDVDGANGTASVVLAVDYWSGSWITTAATVTGVTSATAFDQDGLVYWTVPTAWQTATFREIYPQITAKNYYSDTPLYWTRWSVSGGDLDSATTIDSMTAANRSTAYAELVFGQTLEEKASYGWTGLGCIEGLTNAGTANLIVNVAMTNGSEF